MNSRKHTLSGETEMTVKCGVHLEIRGPRCGVDAHLQPLHGVIRLSLGCQVCSAKALPTDPVQSTVFFSALYITTIWYIRLALAQETFKMCAELPGYFKAFQGF